MCCIFEDDAAICLECVFCIWGPDIVQCGLCLSCAYGGLILSSAAECVGNGIVQVSVDCQSGTIVVDLTKL